MENNNDILKIISNETIDSVHNISIVTPSIYKSFFEKHATTHGTPLEDEEKLTNTLLNQKIQIAQIFDDRNLDNAKKLSTNTNKAITAIKDKDEALLTQVLQETNELRQEIEKLKEAVYRDELTHAYNRKWMHDKFIDNSSDSFTKDGTLVMIDLNFFKLVNDTHGHVVGDKVLVFMANQLKSAKENVVRYGGDEFIVLCAQGVHQDAAFKKIDAIREKIIAKKLKTKEHSFRISFSIGTYEFKKGDLLASVIEHADKNMYKDKIKIKKRITGID
ncbi:MAG: diguanylate cyclase [Sulfurimonas sp.]|jgi:diguanylate cyclase|uniref:GGDEF domain-containing protein n=1 Tax=Sulfurimonas sp. TaxID=2022749 RepID=UPI0039E38444